jgi:hypothetical protein
MFEGAELHALIEHKHRHLPQLRSESSLKLACFSGFRIDYAGQFLNKQSAHEDF